jgi:uncharacterized membrane protein
MLQYGKRVYAIDLARGLAVFFMICIHVLITYGAPHVVNSTFGCLMEFLGSPTAAPVFMALMGTSFYYSRKTNMNAGIRRGLKIIFLGYVLNFFRGVLPVVIAKEFAPSMAAGIPEAVANCKDAFLQIDILHFAGLSLIVMAVIRAFKVNKYYLLFFALVIGAVSPMLWGIQCNIPVLDHFLDYLWGDKPTSEECIDNFVSFPFFPWFTYVLLGMFLGDTWTKSPDMHKAFKKAGIAGILILLGSLVFLFCFSDFMYQLGDYYHSRMGIVAATCGIVLAWLWFCNFTIEKIRMNKVFEIFFYWSRNVNAIYIIQWILIMWGADFILGFDKHSYFVSIMSIIVISAASHFISKLYLKIRNKIVAELNPEKSL